MSQPTSKASKGVIHFDISFWGAIVAGSIVALWLRSGFPVVIRGDLYHDDLLFAQLARTLASGHWLGVFDNRTLVKGIGYPVFVALSFVCGVPLKTAETTFYLFACLSCALIARYTLNSKIGAIFLFWMLALNPVMWNAELARIIRDAFYISLSLLTISLTFTLCFFERPNSSWTIRSLIVLTGITRAWYWLTREEGVWLLPAMGSLIIPAVATNMQRKAIKGSAPVTQLIIRLGLNFSIAAAFVATVAFINQRYYGRFETVEVKSSAFEEAYGALYRVTPQLQRRYIVFPGDVRRKVYTVSPAARELMPAFEGKIGATWRSFGCRFLADPSCPEIHAAFFQWALRDAVAAAGHYQSAATAGEYYQRLANEINQACEKRILRCSPNQNSLAPPFQLQYAREAISLLPSEARVFWSDGLHVPDQPLSVGPLYQYWLAQDIVGYSQPLSDFNIVLRTESMGRDRAINSITKGITSAYRWLLLGMIALSIAYLVAVPISRGLTASPGYFFVLASYVAVGSRMALLAYLDVTAIPSIHILYESSASPFVILSAGLGGLAALQAIADRARKHADFPFSS